MPVLAIGDLTPGDMQGLNLEYAPDSSEKRSVFRRLKLDLDLEGAQQRRKAPAAFPTYENRAQLRRSREGGNPVAFAKSLGSRLRGNDVKALVDP